MIFILSKIKLIIKKLMLYICWIFPINTNKVFVENLKGKGFGDNPKYIIEKFLEESPNTKVVWSIASNVTYSKNDFPEEIKIVRMNSWKYFYEVATSKIWIASARLDRSIRKRKKQLYIQAWHGFGPKRVEKDVEENLTPDYVEAAKNDSKMANYFVSGSSYYSEVYRNAFWFEKEILEVGLPRNDVFGKDRDKIKNKIRDKYQIPKNKKLVLYAPTFRKNHSFSPYNIDFERLALNLKNRFGGEWLVLERFHSNLYDEATKLNQNGIINVSAYPDMQELLHATDVLITDYSSSICDYILTNKPSFIYASDIEEYKNDRNFYFDLDSIASVSETNDELERNILNFSDEDYKVLIDKFKNNTGLIKSFTSSKEVVKIMLEVLETN